MSTNQKKVRITVYPENIEKLSPEAVKASITRRIAHAPENNRRRTLNAFLVFMIALMLMFVAAFASNGQKVEEPAHVCTTQTRTVVVWQGGMSRWDISEEDTALLEAVVSAAARSENQLTQQAVAQAVRNSCDDYDMTVSEVVEKFRWPTNYEDEVTESVKGAVESVIDGYRAVNANIHFAYNSAVQDGKWHESRDFVCQIGNLRFFA